MLAVTPAWQLGSQEFPEPTAMGWLRNMPSCGKTYTRVIGLCNLRSLWPSLTSIKIQNCLSGGSSGSALPCILLTVLHQRASNFWKWACCSCLCLKMVPGKWAWGIILLLPRPGNGHKFEQAPGTGDGQGTMQSMGSQRHGHDQVTELNWGLTVVPNYFSFLSSQIGDGPGHSCGYRLWPASSVHPGCFDLTE